MDARPSRSASVASSAASSARQDSSISLKPRLPIIEMAAFSAMDSVAPTTLGGPKTQISTMVDGKEKKLGHRRVDEQTGQVTYKKKSTTDLMMAVQLGIGQSVGSLTSKPERDVLMQDFSVVETVVFPADGSNLTPAHRVGDFRFKTYAPIAFRYFRELFGIQTDDFLVSLCSPPLRELSNPGASGSVFFITEDDEFIIKTVQHKEADFLQKLLPGYYMNLNQNPRTLLPKFFGLYCYMQGGKNIRLVVMNNLLPSTIKMHEKYDLKGSTYKRKASKHELAKPSPTFKDLDFKEKHPDGLMLEADTYDALMKTIRRDCRVLESFKIMDYSLLLTIHNVDEAKRQRRANSPKPRSQEPSALSDMPSTSAGATGATGGGGITRAKSMKTRLQNFSTAMESIQADVEPVELEDDDIPPGGIPARDAKGERLLIYLGIIDILQSYRFKKKLEHGFKSIVHDADSISVHRPSFYAQRFQTFFEREVFKKVASSLYAKQAMQRGAMRSPSKKKSTVVRQRSINDHEAAGGSDKGGAMLHRSKPDIIPHTQLGDERSRLSSSHTFDARGSDVTMHPSSGLSASSVSTSFGIGGGALSYQTMRDSQLGVVKENSSHISYLQSDIDTRHHDHKLPESDEPLPPYSEHSPAYGTVQVEDLNGSDPPHGAVSLEVHHTAAEQHALSAEAHAQKSSFRREKAEKHDTRRGVRFSHSEDSPSAEVQSDDENSQSLNNIHIVMDNHESTLLQYTQHTTQTQMSSGSNSSEVSENTYL